MRKLLTLGLLMAAVPAAAAPVCVAGTLADYVLLGTNGCTIGGHTVAGLTSTVLYPGAIPIAPADVLVTPVAGVGLDFGIVANTSANAVLDTLIRFTLAGPLLSSGQLSLAGAAATGDGNVTAVQDVCAGGAFGGADPAAPCGGSAATLAVAQDAGGLSSPDDTTFAPASFHDVFVEITLDGGTAGTARLNGVVRSRFDADAVPEPSALLVVALGMASWARRMTRRKA